MPCSCDTSPTSELLPPGVAMDREGLSLFISGVQVGLQTKAVEHQKWTTLAIILAISFGAIAFFREEQRLDEIEEGEE